MKASDFNLSREQAQRLRDTDKLVELGLSHERAKRITDQITDIIEGPWSDLIDMMAQEGDFDKETALIQTFFVAFVYKWAYSRKALAALAQEAFLDHFAKLDGGLDHG